MEHHSATDAVTAPGKSAQAHSSQHDSQQLQPTPQAGHQTRVTTRKPPPTGSTEESVRKPKIRWPKSNDKDRWNSFDEILHTILQGSLKGNAASKLNTLGHIIYEEGKGRFGEMPQKNTAPRRAGRRERKILQLVKERQKSMEESK